MKPKSTMTAVDRFQADAARPDHAPARDGSLRRRVLATVLLLSVMLGAHLPAAEPGARPADALLRLVAPDAAVVLTVEGLRDQVRAFTGAPLAGELWRLPAVRAWIASEKHQQFEQSRARIEAVLGVNLTDLRDELLGDAVVLALRLPPEGRADASLARGLLLFRARDVALLERLIGVINKTQKGSGELVQVGDRQRAGTTYHVRTFRPAAGRPPEWYVAYPDGTFAFSNSELLIQAVIDRKTPTRTAQNAPHAGGGASAVNDPGAKLEPGLGDLPRLHAVQRRLPDERALARLFIDPRQIGRLVAAAPRPAEPSGARLVALLERYLAAVDYAGAALVWSDRSIVIHTAEILDPSRLDPWLRRWAGGTGRVDPGLERVPSSALALVSAHVDALALYDALYEIVPDVEQPKLANIEIVLNGLLLGQDPRTQVLPRLGPGVLVYLDSPADLGQDGADRSGSPPGSWPFPLVTVISLGGDDRGASQRAEVRTKPANTQNPAPITMAAALENALRTVLAVTAMDEKRNQGRSRIVTRTVSGAAVTTLDFPIHFAYAVDVTGSRLVLGTSADSVARYLGSSSDPKAGERFRRLRARSFPGDETFACVDLDALTELAGRHRERLIQNLASRKQRPAADVDRDLTQFVALARLFEAAFVTSRFEPDATCVQRRAGLVLHDEGGK